jgi:hypothetical protein
MKAFAIARSLLGVGILTAFGAGIGISVDAVAPAGASVGSSSAPAICSGTDSAPGQLAGIYNSDVIISGTCWVNAGVTAVYGDLTVDPGSTLNGTFGWNDQAGYTGYSALFVTGNVFVEQGASLVLGCEPNHAPCSDDPVSDAGAPGPGTLSSHSVIGGTIHANGALSVLLHSDVIEGSIIQNGGGGGESCAPPTTGYFASIQSPIYSDYEDNQIGGDLTIQGLSTCWMGAIRNIIGGSLEDLNNSFGDPDANETNSNVIAGSIGCFDNSPQVQFGDGMNAVPNEVGGSALGECAFGVLQQNPVPTGPLAPISVPS